jgi:hypothetical protein
MILAACFQKAIHWMKGRRPLQSLEFQPVKDFPTASEAVDRVGAAVKK